MRNLVAKNNFNRSAVHKTAKSYSRKWSMNWDEIEPPKEFLYKKALEGSIC